LRRSDAAHDLPVAKPLHVLPAREHGRVLISPTGGSTARLPAGVHGTRRANNPAVTGESNGHLEHPAGPLRELVHVGPPQVRAKNRDGARRPVPYRRLMNMTRHDLHSATTKSWSGFGQRWPWQASHSARCYRRKPRRVTGPFGSECVPVVPTRSEPPLDDTRCDPRSSAMSQLLNANSTRDRCRSG
jgi:hypothetical protein